MAVMERIARSRSSEPAPRVASNYKRSRARIKRPLINTFFQRAELPREIEISLSPAGTAEWENAFRQILHASSSARAYRAQVCVHGELYTEHRYRSSAPFISRALSSARKRERRDSFSRVYPCGG